MTPEAFALRGTLIRDRFRVLFPIANCRTRTLKPTLAEVRAEINATRSRTYHDECVIDEEQVGVASPIEAVFDTAPVEPLHLHDDGMLTARERAQLARDVAEVRARAVQAQPQVVESVTVTDTLVAESVADAPVEMPLEAAFA